MGFRDGNWESGMEIGIIALQVSKIMKLFVSKEDKLILIKISN
jgi:hypothetical protein